MSVLSQGSVILVAVKAAGLIALRIHPLSEVAPAASFLVSDGQPSCSLLLLSSLLMLLSRCGSYSNACSPAALWEALLPCLSCIPGITLPPPHHFVALGTLWNSYWTICLDMPGRFSVYFCACWTQESRDSSSSQSPPGHGADYYSLESPHISGHFIILPSDLSQGAQFRIGFRVPSQEPTDIFAFFPNLPTPLHQINPSEFWKQRKLCSNMSGFPSKAFALMPGPKL